MLCLEYCYSSHISFLKKTTFIHSDYTVLHCSEWLMRCVCNHTELKPWQSCMSVYWGALLNLIKLPQNLVNFYQTISRFDGNFLSKYHSKWLYYKKYWNLYIYLKTLFFIFNSSVYPLQKVVTQPELDTEHSQGQC